MTPEVEALLDDRRHYPTQTRGLSGWRRLETRIDWPDPFTAKGTEVRRVD